MFVIYLNDDSRFVNHLGYWTGKTFTHHGETFPRCEDNVNDEVKKYKSKKRAETAAKKVYEKCWTVYEWEVKEIN